MIIGDLADPVFGGPCYQLYTQEFYETVVKAKLAPGGIFVTQSGPAGVLAHKEVFTPINRTLASVFPKVVPYLQHIPSFADCWGWNMAFKDAKTEAVTDAGEVDARIEDRITGGEAVLNFMDGVSWTGVTSLNKILRTAIRKEESNLTIASPKFIHGKGIHEDK